MRGEAPEALLDTYDSERREAALVNCEFGKVNAGHVAKLMMALKPRGNTSTGPGSISASITTARWDLAPSCQAMLPCPPSTIPQLTMCRAQSPAGALRVCGREPGSAASRLERRTARRRFCRAGGRRRRGVVRYRTRHRWIADRQRLSLHRCAATKCGYAHAPQCCRAAKVGYRIKRIATAFDAGRDGFWLARWLRARNIEAQVIFASSVAVSR